MFAVLGLVLFLVAWLERLAGPSAGPAALDWRGLVLLGLAAVAAHLVWPIGRRP